MEFWDKWLRRITGDATQAEIAKRIGVSRATVQRWAVRKVIDPETVLKLARAYRVDPVEGLLAGGWLSLEDISMDGFRAVLQQAPTLFLVQELLTRAEASHAASSGARMPPHFDELERAEAEELRDFRHPVDHSFG